ncbi:hypothetical protein [Magnetofaba australis]|nr:hypothetical protein [Magnetofaba australis]
MGSLRQQYEQQRIDHYMNEENGAYRTPKAAHMAAIWDWNHDGGRRDTALQYVAQQQAAPQPALGMAPMAAPPQYGQAAVGFARQQPPTIAPMGATQPQRPSVAPMRMPQQTAQPSAFGAPQ